MLLRPAILAAAAVALALAAAAPAGAAKYCVHQGGTCPAGQIDKGAGLQSALAAAATPGSGFDEVLIGPGTYAGPFDYVSPDPVHIIGTQTTLTAPGGKADAVLRAQNAFVRGLRVRVPDDPDWIGVDLASGTLQESEVTGGASMETIGVRLSAGAVMLEDVVDVAPNVARAVVTDGPKDHHITRSTLSGAFGVYALPSGATTFLHEDRITSIRPLIVANTTVKVDNSVLRALPWLTGFAPILATCGLPDPHDATVEADHVTLETWPGRPAVSSECKTNGRRSSLKVSNSVAVGGPAYERVAAFGGQADVQLSYSDVHLPGSTSSGAGAPSLSNLIDADPKFVPGTLRPQEGSPVIDAGDPNAVPYVQDLLEKPRKIGARTDMGAFEFDPTDPATALPAAAPPTEVPATPGEDVKQDDPFFVPSDNAGAQDDPFFAPSSADLLAELKWTLATRHGRVYTHRWLVPGTLTIRWRVRSRVVAKTTLTRDSTGVATLRVKGRRRIARRRVRVVAKFTPAGQPALKATRKLVPR